jgi:hypothetical protein
MKHAIGYLVMLPDGHSEKFSSYKNAFAFIEFCSLLGLHGMSDELCCATCDTIWSE